MFSINRMLWNVVVSAYNVLTAVEVVRRWALWAASRQRAAQRDCYKTRAERPWTGSPRGLPFAVALAGPGVVLQLLDLDVLLSHYSRARQPHYDN